MNRLFLKVLKFSVIFSFFFPLVIFKIHTRSRQLVAHAKNGSCAHQRALTFRPSLRLNKLPNVMRYGDVLRVPLCRDDERRFTSGNRKELLFINYKW